MDLPRLQDSDINGKRVLVRLDLDTEPDIEDLRVKASTETLDFLKDKASEITIISHKGRPASADATARQALSLQPFQKIFDKWGAKVHENLRFEEGEEKNDPEFAKKLASMGDFYVNDSFAVSHREHASIVGLPKLLPHAAGLRLEKEVENLSKVFDSSQKPVTVLISGIKDDKVEMARKLSEVFDLVLVGGRLPEFFGDKGLESVRSQAGKLIIGNLTMDKEDITLNTIERFKSEIDKSGTVILAGVLGKYEDEGHVQGTNEIFKAVAGSSAYKIAGGGDTEKALYALRLTDRFNWVSVGGGAMLEFLVHRTLPGIEALL